MIYSLFSHSLKLTSHLRKQQLVVPCWVGCCLRSHWPAQATDCPELLESIAAAQLLLHVKMLRDLKAIALELSTTMGSRNSKHGGLIVPITLWVVNPSKPSEKPRSIHSVNSSWLLMQLTFLIWSISKMQNIFTKLHL